LPRILIITAAGQNVKGIHSGLAQRGFACSIASPQKDIIEQVAAQAPDLILLDINGSPDSGRTELFQEIKRGRPLPIIALVDIKTIESSDINPEVIDDFIVGPGDVNELVLRIKRLLHRFNSTESSEVIRCGDLMIDLAKCEVTVQGRPIELTFKEYELLRFLASHPGRVFNRDTLLNQVWGYDYFGGDRTVDVHIRRLRSKIEGPGHIFIETVRNIGYRFNCNS